MSNAMHDLVIDSDLRRIAYHEAGHKIVYELFGGAGDAVVWKNETESPDQAAWLGQFRPRACVEQTHKLWERAGWNVPALPSNWHAMYGMAGIVAEQIMNGEKEAEYIAGNLFLKICCDEISATDLAAIGVTNVDDFEVDLEAVEQCLQHLLEHWSAVQVEADSLIADASAAACKAVNI